MGTATKRKNFARFVEEQCVTSSACDLLDFARNKPSYSDGNTHTVQLRTLTKLALPDAKMRQMSVSSTKVQGMVEGPDVSHPHEATVPSLNRISVWAPPQATWST